MMFTSVRSIHFVGIGGIGMSGIAEIILSQGFQVSGSDSARSDNTDHLAKLGAHITIGHAAQNIEGADVVVYSSAVKPTENVETRAALDRNIPVIRRAEMLAEVSRLSYCLAVAGTHGKTTTTSMCGMLLVHGGLDPTVIVGGRLRGLGGSNARLGKGQWTVVEADEYDRSFLQLSPTIAVLTNIEAEHLDIYKDLEDIKQTFLQFVSRVPFYGLVVACSDDAVVRELLPIMNKKTIRYGFEEGADLRGCDTEYAGRSSRTRLELRGEVLGMLTLNIPGAHNILNAMAAVAVALQLHIPYATIAASLAEFHGVLRRFEILGEKDGVLVVEDYAHHHTEVKATLDSARKGWNRRIVAVFQPHTYTRTRDFALDFGEAFHNADIVVVTDIYASREKPIDGVSSELIVNALRRHPGKQVHYVPKTTDVADALRGIILPNDMLITLGAGDVYKVAKQVMAEDFRFEV